MSTTDMNATEMSAEPNETSARSATADASRTPDTVDSGTLVNVTAESTQRRAPMRTGYGSLWRDVPRELGFLLLTMPVAIIGLGLLQGLFWAGIGTLIIMVGFGLVFISLYIGRGFGTLELVRLRWAGRDISSPAWRRSGGGFFATVFGPWRDGHYWLYLLHTLFVNPVVSIVTWAVTIVWLAGGLGGISYWFWDRFTPDEGQSVHLSRVVMGAVTGQQQNFDPVTGDHVFLLICGVILLATLPLVTRGLMLLHAAIAQGLLGAWRSEALEREVADLSASRGAAVSAEDQSLRRLERDIHDGPQQRLVRLQMDLASAGRKLEVDPDAARTLLAEAQAQAKDTLDELRALSRGFAPPILQDRGLDAALRSLVSRSTLPVDFVDELAPGERLTSEIERNAYFVAAELLTNVAKHAGAASATLTISTGTGTGTGAGNGAGSAGRALLITVTDDGAGGAALIAGHGLAGLDERLHGLRGTLTLASPAGGPTRIVASLPLPD